MNMMGTACFATTTNVVPNLSANFSNLLGPKPKPLHLQFPHPRLGRRVKLTSFSMSRATHLHVSQDALTPTEESLSSSPRVVGEHDLLIVGPGVLGRLVAQNWREEIPGCQVYGQTMTTDHHNELIQMGINPSLRWTEANHKFPNILYCAPPSRTPNYADNVRLAALSWNGEGSFLFTSSSAPYDCNDNGPCDEDTPVIQIGRSPRVDILLKAENVVLESGGCVLRLAGLYISFIRFTLLELQGFFFFNPSDNCYYAFFYLMATLDQFHKADRGAHNYYLEKGTVDSRPDHILNLIHYEDAASLAIAILKKKFHRQIFLGCDNHPLSRQEMMNLVNRSGKFSKRFDKFTVTDGPLGKRLNNARTRREVGWEPKYPSFARFLESI